MDAVISDFVKIFAITLVIVYWRHVVVWALRWLQPRLHSLADWCLETSNALSK